MEDYDEGPGTPVKMGHYTVNDTFNFKEDKGVRMPYVEDKEVLFKDNIYFVEYKAVGQIAGSNPQFCFPHMRVKLSVDTVINIHARSQHKVIRIACDISELYDGENL